MEDEKVTFGLRLESVIEHGYRRVRAVLMRRCDDCGFPLNLDGNLRLEAYISDYDGKHFLSKPAYSDIYCVELAQAKEMVTMLSRVTRAIEKAEAREAGDVFMAFAKAAGASWICIPLEDGARYSAYSDIGWHWMSLTQGRDRFRYLIGKAEEEQRQVGIRKAA